MREAANSGFFEVAAQLIPVLFLVVIVETRLRMPSVPWYEEPDRPVRGALYRLGLLAAVVLAETAALIATAGRPTVFETWLVVQLLGVLGVYVIAPPIIQELTQLHPVRHRAALPAALVAMLVLLLPLVPGIVYGVTSQ